MTDKELEDAFDETAKTWSDENPMIDRRMARYFFFAGASFGMEVTAKIHDQHYGSDGVTLRSTFGVST